MQQGPGRTVRISSLSAEAIAPVFLDLDMRNAEHTRGSFTILDLQGLSIVRSVTRGGAFQVFREERHIRGSPTSDFFACMPVRGPVTVTQEGRSCTLGRGDIALMDSQLEYALDMPDQMDALWIRIPRQRFEGRLDGFERMVAHRMDGSRGLGMIASRFILTSASQLPHMGPSQMAPIGSIIVDLLSAAAVQDATAAPRRKPSPLMTLERAKAFIEHNLGDEDLSLTRIAASIGVSNRYLTALFATEQSSPMAWVRQRRLGACRAALEAQTWNGGAITDIAFRYGFGNVSSFNRVFKAEFGTSPRKVMRRS